MNTADVVEIVVPARNEEEFIAEAVRSLMPSDGTWHMTVVDGCSSDDTVAAVEAIGDPRISVVSNPMLLQSSGVNLVAMSLPPAVDALVRADAHCLYPPDFVTTVVETLRRTGADSVVVAMRSEARAGTFFGRAVAAAQNSRLGNGGSAHRNGGHSGFVDHGHHAAFRRETFVALGGYDETFSHNEDAEYDMRAKAGGFRVYLDGDAAIVYFVRETAAALARQYFNHGAGRARTVLKHKTIRPRQAAPAAVTAVNFASVAMSVFCPILLVIPGLYAMACLGIGATRKDGWAERFAGVPAMIMHHSWGAGFILAMANGISLKSAALRFLGVLAWRAS